MPNLTWSFESAVRGYHFYRKYWKPYLLQRLECNHEPENAFDRFAIKMFIQENGKEKIVGHLRREILRPTKFLLARGAVMHAELSSDKYRKSPLVQGGLELLCKVYVSMPPTVMNENLISRYKSLVASLYVEPPKEAEVGSFENEKETDISVDSTTAKVKSNVETKKKRKSQPETSTEKQNLAKKQSKDIRSFFTPSKENKSNNQTRKTEPSKNSVIDLTE